MTEEKLYTIQQTADFLTIHKQNLYKLLREGKIKSVKVTPRRSVIFKSEIERYLSTLR